MFEGLFDGIANMLWVGAISFLLCIGFVAYEGWNHLFHKNTIESHHRLVPETRLHTDGKTVDTIYIYKAP